MTIFQQGTFLRRVLLIMPHDTFQIDRQRRITQAQFGFTALVGEFAHPAVTEG